MTEPEPTWENDGGFIPWTKEDLENDFSDFDETPEREFLRLTNGLTFTPEDFIEVFEPGEKDAD